MRGSNSFIVCGVALAVASMLATPRAARADITDLFNVIRPVFSQAPSSVSESPLRRLLLNGFPLQLRSGRTAESPRQLLDSYESRARNSAQGALPAPIFRRDGEDFGLLVTVLGQGEELLSRMAARKLHYVHLAPLSMVFAQRGGELTTYLAITSDAPLPPDVLSPPRGRDAPGADLVNVPRPPGSLRSFSLHEPAAGYAAVSYIADEPPGSAFSATLAILREAGFTVDASFGKAAYAAGSLTMRMQRGRVDLIVSAVSHAAAERSVILYVVRSL